jgi:hypothetical protein
MKEFATSVCSRTAPIVWDTFHAALNAARIPNADFVAANAGTSLLAALNGHNGGDSIVYISFPQAFADHNMIIEHCGAAGGGCTQGHIRVYHSWVGNFNLNEWMGGHNIIAGGTGNQVALTAAGNAYGNDWFDPAVAWTAAWDLWYAGVMPAALNDVSPIAGGAGAAFAATMGVSLPAAITNRNPAHKIAYRLSNAPVNHDCAAGDVYTRGIKPWFPSADCVYCYGVATRWLAGRKATPWCNGIANSNGNCATVQANMKTALGHVGGLCGYSARTLLTHWRGNQVPPVAANANDICRHPTFGLCTAVMDPSQHPGNGYNNFFTFFEESSHAKKGKLSHMKSMVLQQSRAPDGTPEIFDHPEKSFDPEPEKKEDAELKKKKVVDGEKFPDSTLDSEGICHEDVCNDGEGKKV